jgi:hypothetical protein
LFQRMGVEAHRKLAFIKLAISECFMKRCAISRAIQITYIKDGG